MYRRGTQGVWKHLDFIIIDLICIELAYGLCSYYRLNQVGVFYTDFYQRMAIVLGIVDLLIAFLLGNYKGIIQRTKFPELVATFQYVTVVELVFLLYTYLTKNADLHSRYIFVLSWSVALVLDYGCRVIWKKIVRRAVTRKSGKAQMLLIVDPNRCYKCVEALYDKPYRSFEISTVAFWRCERERQSRISKKDDKNRIFDASVIYGKDEIIEHVRQQVVDEVYIDDLPSRDDLNELTDLLLSMGITVHIGSGFLPETIPNKLVEQIGRETAFTTSIQVASSWKLVIKRAVDILGGLVGLLLMCLLSIFVVPAIKIADPGPVFFKQKRVGKNGRIFEIYKFRSMYMDAEERKKELMSQNEMQGLMFKLENDPRIIGSEKGSGKGLGNFIRKTSIDEFPQFINILKGDMSLVGTRPPTADEFSQYDLHHKVRLSMKPGLTGMWQVSGRSEITDFEEVVRLDAEYVNKWNLRLDIKILLKTFVVVLKGKGSK